MPAPANLLFFLSDNHNRALAGCYGHPIATTPNLDRIAALFPQGGSINPDTLAEAGAVRRGQPVKVLGTGDLGGIEVHVHAHAFSSSAAEKIGAAGGSATRI